MRLFTEFQELVARPLRVPVAVCEIELYSPPGKRIVTGVYGREGAGDEEVVVTARGKIRGDSVKSYRLLCEPLRV